MPAVPDWLEKKIEAGELGKKTGKGLYTWKDGKPVKKSVSQKASDDLTDRLLLPMVNMCMSCLREGVIDDPYLLDGAMIFGTGFAPFKGGPLHYANNRGHTNIIEAMQTLAEQYGPRFKPDAGFKTAD